MLKSFFKTAWRNLVKNKFPSFINIGGLAIGMVVAMLIGCWIWDELTFNHYHSNHNKIAEIVSLATYNGSINADEIASVSMANELRSKYPDDFEKVALVMSGDRLLSFWFFSFVFILLTALLAGSYPALYLSSFKPVKVLKGVFRAGRFAAAGAGALIITLFTVSFQAIKAAIANPVSSLRTA